MMEGMEVVDMVVVLEVMKVVEVSEDMVVVLEIMEVVEVSEDMVVVVLKEGLDL